MNLNNPSKFKSINTIAGSKNGSVSEKGGSSNGTGNFIYMDKIVDVLMYVCMYTLPTASRQWQ
jgi:hypothetical protein